MTDIDGTVTGTVAATGAPDTEDVEGVTMVAD
jgi:hypothetical protein